MKDVNEMSYQEIASILGITTIHSDDKDAMDIEQLRDLAALDYVDVSWGNDECASFLSPCGHYQVFVGYSWDFALPISICHITDDGDVTYLLETNSLSEALAAARTHNLNGEA